MKNPFVLRSKELVRLVEPGHTYIVGEGITEREVVSLSRLLGTVGLATDYSTVDPMYLDFRSRVGTLTHQWAELFATYGEAAADRVLDEDDPFVVKAAIPHIEAFFSFARSRNLSPERLEVPAYNPGERYCCTADFVGYLNGKPSVIDYKTTAKISGVVGLQTAGQALCFKKWGDFDRYALHLKKNGAFELVPFTETADFEDVESAARTYHARARVLS